MKYLIVFVLIILLMNLSAQAFDSHINKDYDFCGRTILVTLDGNTGVINRIHSTNLFKGIEIESIRDLTRIDGDLRSLRVNEETFRQILLITLNTDCKANILDVIEKLRYVQGIEFAEPNYIISSGDFQSSNEQLKPPNPPLQKGGDEVCFTKGGR